MAAGGGQTSLGWCGDPAQGPGWGPDGDPGDLAKIAGLRLLSTVETVETLVFACRSVFFVLFRKFNGL